MRKKVVALALASVMMVGGVVGAATAYQTFTATQRPDIKVIMDGKIQDYKDANGNTVYPVIINGTTYLPLRPIANSFGKDVHWNNDTQTITLGEPQPINLVDVAELKNSYVDESSKVKGEEYLTFSNIGDIGVSYQSAVKLKFYEWGSSAILNLNSSYNKLSCSILATADAQIKILNKATGVAIVDREVKANEIIELKDLDINGVEVLEFEAKSGMGKSGWAYMLNPTVK